MRKDYSKAYTEVLEILKHMPKEDVRKIPQEMLNMFNEKRDTTYDFKISDGQEYKDIQMLPETQSIMINIYIDYWASREERKQIIAHQINKENKLEEEKRAKYNSNYIFKN